MRRTQYAAHLVRDAKGIDPYKIEQRMTNEEKIRSLEVQFSGFVQQNKNFRKAKAQLSRTTTSITAGEYSTDVYTKYLKVTRGTKEKSFVRELFRDMLHKNIRPEDEAFFLGIRAMMMSPPDVAGFREVWGICTTLGCSFAEAHFAIFCSYCGQVESFRSALRAARLYGDQKLYNPSLIRVCPSDSYSRRLVAETSGNEYFLGLTVGALLSEKGSLSALTRTVESNSGFLDASTLSRQEENRKHVIDSLILLHEKGGKLSDSHFVSVLKRYQRAGDFEAMSETFRTFASQNFRVPHTAYALALQACAKLTVRRDDEYSKNAYLWMEHAIAEGNEYNLQVNKALFRVYGKNGDVAAARLTLENVCVRAPPSPPLCSFPPFFSHSSSRRTLSTNYLKTW